MDRRELKSTERFTDRVADYVRYRPSYPASLIDFLDSKVGGLRRACVADIGAGTGILTGLLLERGAEVHAVEPNDAMRSAAVSAFSEKPGFHECKGTAEATGLPPTCVDLITSAQAFHWFDPVQSRQEFDRILKPQGFIALIWNEQDQDIPLGREYEQIKTDFGGESFSKVVTVTENVEFALGDFFDTRGFESHLFQNYQDLDRAGLQGRFFSSSYAPAADSPIREKAVVALNALFDRFQKGGKVRLEYKTQLYLGN